jgi:protein TonB
MDTYNYVGPLISSEHFKNAEMTVYNGLQTFYHRTGFIDSTGNIENGVLQGDWQYFNDTGRLAFKKKYDKGVLTYFEDVINNPDTSKSKDTTDSKDEMESSFPGGLRAWQRFLLKNLQYPERALQANIMGESVTIFIVNTNGEIEDPRIFRSVEFSIDDATIALIKKSPKWIPATQKGRLVKTYKKQPIVYRFQ